MQYLLDKELDSLTPTKTFMNDLTSIKQQLDCSRACYKDHGFYECCDPFLLIMNSYSFVLC